MPRVAKPKAAAPAKKAVPAKKAKSKLYKMPEKVKEGTVFTDLAKGQWRIGPSIGVGGFGEIYAACKVGEKNYDAVVKCEPHGNGPLFVEMHFYLRNAKLEDIKQFMQKNGLKSLGMPYILANGSVDVNGEKHRFIVMPRYGSDLTKFLEQNGKRLPEGTVYRLAIQMLDVFQYMHSNGYVHADLKAANILLGLGKGGAAQAYLVDFGLASHFVTGDFKPDPKKMHNGTIEYTSRDAHLGVPTRRADLEILGYNLIEWLGAELPWVTQKLLDVPLKVQKAKEAFMDNIGESLKSLFPKGVPPPIGDFMKYVSKLTHKQEPDYDKCRSWFSSALKQLKVPNSGDLDFKLKAQTSSNNNLSPPGTSKAATARKARKIDSPVLNSSLDEEISASEEDEEEDKSYRKKTAKKVTPSARNAKVSPLKRVAPAPAAESSPPGRKRVKTEPKSTPKERATPKTSPKPKGTPKASPKPQTPTAARLRTPNAKINFSPSISLRGRPGGKTVINDDLTPQPRSKKTYEFNFELDVSMDANVIVNVKRKKKEEQDKATAVDSRTPSSRSALASSSNEQGSPVTRVNLRKVNGHGDSSTPGRSPRTPAVTVRKYQG
ncbi:nucleosomal histone kinase 1 [Drosophila mauritiana]|uniref:non-specific serine/threonine protein kinase n=1 Tax=Drosophila mauritiana TaxID=7226 RepID=A0A6P8KEF4_DROMA|nr:nucleosomal histone kinase 1 [Drosophila mauritiana]